MLMENKEKEVKGLIFSIQSVWKAVFPGSVTPMSQMSADLMAHMRYPEDLFKAH